MRGGKLRRVVSITQPTITQTGTGNPQATWTTFAATVFADIQEQNGKEALQAGQVNAQQLILVNIRYQAGITPKMRVLYGARTFEIMAVRNVNERNRELELTCLERQ